MKTIKNILASILVILAMSQFLGQDIVSFYNHVKCHTESSSNQSNANKLQSSETSVEEEIAVEIPNNTSPSVCVTKESYILTSYFFPNKLYYSIWLPPDIS